MGDNSYYLLFFILENNSFILYESKSFFIRDSIFLNLNIVLNKYLNKKKFCFYILGNFIVLNKQFNKKVLFL